MFDTLDIILGFIVVIATAIFVMWHFKVSYLKVITSPIALLVYLLGWCLLIGLLFIIACIALPVGFIQLALKEWGVYNGENIWTECPSNPWNTKHPWFGSPPS